MDAGLIARRYATVLHDFAADKKLLDDVYLDAQTVRTALQQNPEALKFLDSPLRKNSEKKSLLNAALKDNVTPLTLQFLSFLVEKERIGYVSSILLVFQTLYKKEHNIRTAKVTTATQLSDQQKKRFVDLIALKLNNAGTTADSIDASFKTDPSIIGGLILEVDGRQIDSSVASKLQALQRQLTV